MQRVLVWALGLAFVLTAGSAFAQGGNSDCSGTIQGGAGQTACDTYGLCRAYFAGSQTGQDHKHNAGPFQALAAASCSGDCTSSGGCSGSTSCCCTTTNSCDTTDNCVADFCPDSNPAGHGQDPAP